MEAGGLAGQDEALRSESGRRPRPAALAASGQMIFDLRYAIDAPW